MRNFSRHTLSDGHYKVKQEGHKPAKVFIESTEDSLVVYKDNQVHKTPLHPDAKFIKECFDIDVILILFKYRPAEQNLPRQLTAEFNGNIYLGYRIDRYNRYSEDTPAGTKKIVNHFAMTVGVFGGLGSTSVTPWTTNNKTTDEYNALILSRGVALMGGINKLTIGVGVGWDMITDRDKDIWIYQNKPWFGMTLGHSLN